MENLELHAAAVVAIPALIMLARHLAGALPGDRAMFANVAAQLLTAAGIAIGMSPGELGAETIATAGVMGIGQFLASWLAIGGIKRLGGEAGDKLVKGKTWPKVPPSQ